MKYNDWSELLKDRPLDVGLKMGGLPRTGTTISYINLAEIIRQARPDVGICGEYWNSTAEIRLNPNYNVLYKARVNNNNPSQTSDNLQKRIDLLKKYDQKKHFFKMFPHEYGILLGSDEKFMFDLVSNNHWLFFLRHDYIRTFFSWYYSSMTSVWHYSDFDNLVPVEPINHLDPERITHWQRNLVLLDNMAELSHSHKVIYTHEISHLPNLVNTKIVERTDKNEMYKILFKNITYIDDLIYEITARTIKNRKLKFLTIENDQLLMKDKK